MTKFDTELKKLTESSDSSETMGIEELLLNLAKKQGIKKHSTRKKEGLREGKT